MSEIYGQVTLNDGTQGRSPNFNSTNVVVDANPERVVVNVLNSDGTDHSQVKLAFIDGVLQIVIEQITLYGPEQKPTLAQIRLVGIKWHMQSNSMPLF